MNGRGVLCRTSNLTDALWAAVPGAVIGSSAIVVGPLVSWAALIHAFPWDEPATVWHWIAAGVISAASMIGGYFAARPWWRVRSALVAHTKAMERETETRGRGWAEN